MKTWGLTYDSHTAGKTHWKIFFKSAQVSLFFLMQLLQQSELKWKYFHKPDIIQLMESNNTIDVWGMLEKWAQMMLSAVTWRLPTMPPIMRSRSTLHAAQISPAVKVLTYLSFALNQGWNKDGHLVCVWQWKTPNSSVTHIEARRCPSYIKSHSRGRHLL